MEEEERNEPDDASQSREDGGGSNDLSLPSADDPDPPTVPELDHSDGDGGVPEVSGELVTPA
jgi:hypothetical protein